MKDHHKTPQTIMRLNVLFRNMSEIRLKWNQWLLLWCGKYMNTEVWHFYVKCPHNGSGLVQWMDPRSRMWDGSRSFLGHASMRHAFSFLGAGKLDVWLRKLFLSHYYEDLAETVPFSNCHVIPQGLLSNFCVLIFVQELRVYCLSISFLSFLPVYGKPSAATEHRFGWERPLQHPQKCLAPTMKLQVLTTPWTASGRYESTRWHLEVWLCPSHNIMSTHVWVLCS